MTTIAARYDASALAYRTWWEPVLAPAALGLLDRLEQLDGPPTGGAIDVGTGAGLLAIEAVRRWPTIRVLGLDGSAEMLAVARQTAEANLPAAARARLAWLRGHAERLPGADASVDLVISSFAYQLVPRLTAALTDAFRVLRPGGRLAFVTWRIADDRFAPDEAFEDALDELEPPTKRLTTLGRARRPVRVTWPRPGRRPAGCAGSGSGRWSPVRRG